MPRTRRHSISRLAGGNSDLAAFVHRVGFVIYSVRMARLDVGVYKFELVVEKDLRKFVNSDCTMI